MAIVSAIRKTGKGKKRMLFAVGCFVLMVIGGAISPDAKETTNLTKKDIAPGRYKSESGY
jgi:hypothetical protein